MQNTGKFNHFCIARFEASLKYVILICRLIKTLLHTFQVYKCLKYKKQMKMELHYIKKNTNIFTYLNQNL